MSEAKGEDRTCRNTDIEAIHQGLIALVSKLELSIDTAVDPAAIAAITDQMAEVNARVTSTGSVLLARRSDEITRLAGTIVATLPVIEAEIDSVSKYERLVRSVSGLLSTVDDAVRVAARLCP